jgi:Flp pilus assembly pilin Flp
MEIIHSLYRNVVKLRTSVDGQGLIEYALLLMLVAFVVLGLIMVFGSSVGTLYSNIIRAI